MAFQEAAAGDAAEETVPGSLAGIYVDGLIKALMDDAGKEGSAKNLLPSYDDPVLTGLSANLYAFLSENEDLIPENAEEKRDISLRDMTNEYLKALPWIKQHALSKGDPESAFALSERAPLSFMEDYKKAVSLFLSGEKGDAGIVSAYTFMEHVLNERRHRVVTNGLVYI